MPQSAKSSKGTAASGKLQPLQTVLPVYQGTDPSSLIFSEWVDQEINAEKWDHPKMKAQKSPKTSAESPREPTCYKDPHTYTLPGSIQSSNWKRVQEVFPYAVIVMYKEATGYSNFLNGSKHILQSEFMRTFISSIGILEYLGYTCPWPYEAVGPNYTPNTTNEPWKPWHHVYSMCKAGKGQTHRPQVNNLGKYIVRLYWMGCWRKILVDDHIPIDNLNHVLLPILESSLNKNISDEWYKEDLITAIKLCKEGSFHDNKKGGHRSKTGNKMDSKDGTPAIWEVELWPFLLCKALLKVANLTWSSDEELVDLDIISALTGWIVQKISTHNLSCTDIWDMCTAYTDEYQWPEDKTKATKEGKDHKDKASNKSSKGKDRTSNASQNKGELDGKIQPYCLVASLSDLRHVLDGQVQEISPCWSHTFLIHQTRNIPILQPHCSPDMPRWKKFRWVQWALDKGIDVEEGFERIRCLKMFSTFRKFREHIVYRSSRDILRSIALSEFPSDDGKKETLGKKSSAQNKSSKGPQEKISKTTKASKETSRKDEKTLAEVTPDPSIWGNFNELYKYIDWLYVFLKPSQFSTNIKITDFKEVAKEGKPVNPSKTPKGDEKVQQKIIWPNTLSSSRNEPLYMFTDSIDYKYLVFNLSQAGNSDIITSAEDLTLCLNLDYVFVPSHRPISHIVIEKYDWQSNEIGEMSVSVNTYGSKSILVLVKPGRHCFRLWLNSTAPYVVHILCNVEISAGTSEVVLEAMQAESQLLTQTCYDMGSYFGKLVQAFGTPEYLKQLRSFYSSYKPGVVLRKQQSTLIHEAFFEQLLLLIKETYPDSYKEVVFAFRILFMQPYFGWSEAEVKHVKYHRMDEATEPDGITYIDPYGQKYSGPLSVVFVELLGSEDEVEQMKKEEAAAAKVQAFFKMVYIRKMQKYHSIDHKQYLSIFQTLKKVYNDLFSVDNRIIYLMPVLRNLVLTNDKLGDIRKLYTLYGDLQSVVHFQHLLSTIPVVPQTWTPLGKCEFFINSSVPEVIKITLYCDISHYLLRVFNNDTTKEVTRLTNNACVSEYCSNYRGYTVLAYGWSEENTSINWKFCFISLKKTSIPPIEIPEKHMSIETLSDIFIPNVHNLICRCLITITKDTNISFKLSCSLDTVKIKLRCMDESNNTCAEIVGTGTIILPIVILKSPSSESKIRFSNAASSVKLRSSHVKKRRRSSEGASTKGSASSLKLRGKISSSEASAIPSKTITIVSKFLVEGYVLEDSWPLTSEEWEYSEEVKKRNLIGPSMYPKTTTLVSSSKVSLKKDAPKKNLDRRSSSTQVLPNPHWCMQAIYDKSDDAGIAIDRRREIEINNMKQMWYDEDPNRYEDSKKLRDTYLADNYVKNPNAVGEPLATSAVMICKKTGQTFRPLPSYGRSVRFSSKTSEDKSSFVFQSEVEVRSLCRPVQASKMLPPVDYMAFVPSEIIEKMSNPSYTNVEQIMEDGILKKQEDVEFDELMVQEAIQVFTDKRCEYLEYMDELLKKQVAQNLMMENWFKECKRETYEMMKDAYDLRDKFIEGVIAAEEARLLLEKGSPRESVKKDKGKKRNN